MSCGELQLRHSARNELCEFWAVKKSWELDCLNWWLDFKKKELNCRVKKVWHLHRPWGQEEPYFFRLDDLASEAFDKKLSEIQAEKLKARQAAEAAKREEERQAAANAASSSASHASQADEVVNDDRSSFGAINWHCIELFHVSCVIFLLKFNICFTPLQDSFSPGCSKSTHLLRWRFGTATWRKPGLHSAFDRGLQVHASAGAAVPSVGSYFWTHHAAHSALEYHPFHSTHPLCDLHHLCTGQRPLTNPRKEKNSLSKSSCFSMESGLPAPNLRCPVLSFPQPLCQGHSTPDSIQFGAGQWIFFWEKGKHLSREKTYFDWKCGRIPFHIRQCLCMSVCCLWQICAQLNGAGCPDWHGSNPPEFYPVGPGVFWKCGGGKLDQRSKGWTGSEKYGKNTKELTDMSCIYIIYCFWIDIIAFCKISLHSQVASILGGLTFALTFGISVQLCSNFCIEVLWTHFFADYSLQFINSKRECRMRKVT